MKGTIQETGIGDGQRHVCIFGILDALQAAAQAFHARGSGKLEKIIDVFTTYLRKGKLCYEKGKRYDY